MTQLNRFEDFFPAENISHHFIGQDQARGIYAKELRIPGGALLVTHEHSYDHLSILASGMVDLMVDGTEKTLTGPCAIMIKAGLAHGIRALTDAVWFCIHPTEETDASRVDEVILG
jgi:quercetin dioxygenase-like cupin family protein